MAQLQAAPCVQRGDVRNSEKKRQATLALYALFDRGLTVTGFLSARSVVPVDSGARPSPVTISSFCTHRALEWETQSISVTRPVKRATTVKLKGELLSCFEGRTVVIHSCLLREPLFPGWAVAFESQRSRRAFLCRDEVNEPE